ncbi:MAG: hypothetical protein JXB25_12265 [Deltaproteobacteria bacterium]|nr:hypothetical protein [Deltaproteobacteria bacterium]
MRKMTWLAVLALLALGSAACSNSNFLISGKEYRNKVKTLGVLPLLVDTGSEIAHPDRQGILSLIQSGNRDQTSYLIQRLKRGGGYFDVRPVEGDPEDLFANLITGTELVARPDSFYRSYRFNGAYAGELARKNLVDGLLVIVLNGVATPRKHWDRTRINYLEAEYNLIVESAFVAAADGALLWEYSGNPSEPFLLLQYPDFDEAHYNKTNKVKIKWISLEGLERVLRENSLPFPGEQPIPRTYKEMLLRVADRLQLWW